MGNEGVGKQNLQHLNIIKTEIKAKKKCNFFMSKRWSFNLLYSWTSNLGSICFCYVYLNISVFTIWFCYVNIVYHVLCYIHARHQACSTIGKARSFEQKNAFELKSLHFSYQNSFLWLKASSFMFYLKPWISKEHFFMSRSIKPHESLTSFH